MEISKKKIFLVAIFTVLFAFSALMLANALNEEATFKNTPFIGGRDSSGFWDKTEGRRQKYIEGVNGYHYDETGYKTYKTGQLDNGNYLPRRVVKTTGVTNPIYCLDGTLEFPASTGNTYRNIGELKDVIEIQTASGNKRITEEQKRKLYWLFANMYSREASQAEKLFRREKILEETLKHAGQSPQELNLRYLAFYVTEDDMLLINQWLIWEVINNTNMFETDITNGVQTSGNTINHSSERQEARKKVYRYLKQAMSQGLNYNNIGIPQNFNWLLGNKGYEPTTKTFTNILFNIKGDEGKLVEDIQMYYKQKGSNNLVESLKIDRSKYNLSLESAPGNILNESLLEVAKRGAMRIKLKENIPANVDGVIFGIKYSNLRADVYTSTEKVDGNAVQPLVEILKAQNNVSLIIPIPEVDFALRKSIIAVDNTAISGDENRLPTIHGNNFKNSSLGYGSQNDTTLKYAHKKSPILVNKGSVIRYRINVYNEGDADGKVLKIHDKLPEHLELLENSQINTKYGWRKLANNVVETEYTKNTTLIKLDNFQNLTNGKSNTHVEIELKVKENAPANIVQTNIASIVEQTPAGDRDSNTNNTAYPGDLPGYKGHSSNKSELSDKDYHYKGQEDDDDFEKVIVKETPPAPKKDVDFALRKSIVAVNGQNISIEKTRLPEIEGGNFKNLALEFGSKNDTTLKYKHKKDPIEVGKGNIVRYRINVYNEGDVEGKVLKIHDKLPEHLEFLDSNDINTRYGWRKLANDVVETEYTKNTNLLPLDNLTNLTNGKSNTYVEIELRVKQNAPANIVQTNIASIVEQAPAGDRDSNTNNTAYPADLPGYKGHSSNKSELADRNYHYKGQEDDDDFEKVIVKETPPVPTPVKEMDLALRKSIIAVNGVELSNEKSRLPEIEGGHFKNLALKFGNQNDTTLKYKHKKDPVLVEKGNIVRYRINVYNEGDVVAKALKIHDKLPEYLEYIENNTTNTKYGWKLLENNIVETTYTKDTNLAPLDNLANLTNGKSNTYVEIELRVKQNATANIVQTNIASIVEQTPVGDRDSVPANTAYPGDLPGYKGHSSNKSELADRNYHYKGQEDDDDFEKVIVKETPLPTPNREFDLALRKFTISRNGVSEAISREPKVDVTPLKNGQTTAKYTHPKNPLTVENKDIVKYKLRVYNEAELIGVVDEIIDHLPKGLGFLIESEVNKKYNWKYDTSIQTQTIEKDGKIYKYVSGDRLKIVSDYLKPQIEQNKLIEAIEKNQIPAGYEDKMLKGFDKNSSTTLDYKEVELEVIVIATEDSNNNLLNISEIKEDYPNIPKKPIDRDSTPNNVRTENYPPNQEDDDDYEPLKMTKKDFDLSLRKFITKISSKDNSRVKDYKEQRTPKVDVTPLKNGKTTAIYTHPKNPLFVTGEDRVEYIIRVYNEGEIAGYVEKIIDNVPKGLIFEENDEINKKYGWKLISTAPHRKVETDYLSKAKSKQRNEDNELKPFDGQKLDYRDVKIAFRVEKGYKPKDGIIKNIAEITKDFNEKGIKDRDSIPNNVKIEGYGETNQEDDDDFDRLKPQEFDLSLLKIVSKIMITENGKERIIETKHKYEDRPEKVAKAELKTKDLSKVEVKWEYKIRVENEGDIEGYAEEIIDYIPEGTYFDPKDNPKWRQLEDKKIVTDQLKDKLLKPGDRAEVVVYLRWKKDPKNLGVKVNWAEINKDRNEFKIPDKDSVPGNRKPGEDDIDDAPVALSIPTGRNTDFVYYILLGLSTTGIILAIYKNKVNKK